MKTQTILRRVFAQPTAPFREGWVLREIAQILTEHEIPFFQDSFGNLIAGAARPSELRGKLRLALQAHTDHPGFHIVEALDSRRYRALWYGGAPFKQMRGARLRVFDPKRPGQAWEARCEEISTTYTREGLPLTLKLSKAATLTPECFGAFAFEGYQLKGDQIHSRAADDLSGVCIALGALIDQKEKRPLAVFTRAEEVGFVGCIKLLESGLLPQHTWLLCLEASRELPLAELGRGPVLRLGDRSTVYNSDFSQWLWKSAEGLKKFAYQRRLLDGGSCEATAMSLYGYTATGLAVPLRNYHNQGSSRPKPEIISLSDVEGARRLCGELYRLFDERPSPARELKRGLKKNARSLQKLLKPVVYG